MKEQNISTGSNGETALAKKKETRTLRGGATAIVQKFKERQRLPVLTMLGETNDWPGSGPELGSFYHL